MPRHWKCSPLLTIKNPFPGARMPHTRADSGGRMKKRTGCGDGECLVDGVADIDVSMTGERLFSVVVSETRWPAYGKNIFPAGDALPRCVQAIDTTPGDTVVTWGARCGTATV